MIIKNKETNTHFLKVIEVLMDDDPTVESPQGQALRFLADAVKQFEDKEYGN